MAIFISKGVRDDPDEPLEGCGAAGRPCVGPPACECNERPTRGGRVKYLSPLMAEVLFVDNAPNANHISPIDPKGFDVVPNSPGYRTGIRPGYCSLTLLRTTSKSTSMLGARTCSLSVTDVINKRKPEIARERRSSGYLEGV